MNMNIYRQAILEQLRQGNSEVLKGLPASLILSLGIELQKEQNIKELSPIDSNEVGKFMLDRITDIGIKERLIKEMEQAENN